MREMSFHPLAQIFPLIEGPEFDALVSDVREHGLREPIVVFEGAILDGRNRFRACESAGIPARYEVYEGVDPVGYVISLNLRRRHLDESQRAMVAARLANLSEGRPAKNSANLPSFLDDEPQKTTSAISVASAASLLNVSERSVTTARAVQRDGAPELVSAVERGVVRISAAADVATLPKPQQAQIVARGEREILEAAKEIRAKRADESRTVRIERIAEISKGNAELDVTARYPVIYADPPWRYENPPMGGTNRSIENHYPTMSLDEICALRVSDLATEDAILYLWATAPKLAECMKVIEAWGFEYRTNFVWIKDKIGMGYHARNQHEILLVAKRGAIPPPAVSDRVSSVVHGDRTEHSAKPVEFYALIESFYPTLPKIELFSRSPQPGWAVWGNQSEAA